MQYCLKILAIIASYFVDDIDFVKHTFQEGKVKKTGSIHKRLSVG